MFPTLFELGPLKLRAYGLLLAAAFLVGSWIALRIGRRDGIDDDRLLNLFWWILVSSIIGARLYFVIAHPELFAGPIEALEIWKGGMILHGGVVAAILTTWIYARRTGLGFLRLADVVVPAVALGEAIGRIGCLLNGCCFGRACGSPPGIHYPEGSFPSRVLGTDVASFPSSLLLALLMGLLFLLLLNLGRRNLVRGAVFSTYLIGQGAVRYGVDFSRYYEPTDQLTRFGFWLGSRSQMLALGFTLMGVILLATRLGRWRRTDELG